MTDTPHYNLEKWRIRLNASGLPVFSRTIREINNISTNQSSSAKDLSDAIGHDASMAARVIQIANSPVFNLQHRDIDTISTAVVRMGFDAVRDLVITVSVIEEMLKGDQHARVGKHMARAFHAAAQARSFALSAGDKPEEVFVGALLKHVGEMAFWSRADSEADAIEAELAAGVDSRSAQKKVLGFELAKLSQVLAEDWSLGDMVTRVVDDKRVDEAKLKHVHLGHDLAGKLEEYSWNTPEVKEVLKEVADHLELSMKEVEILARENLDAAASIAEGFGVKNLGETLKKEVGSNCSAEGEGASHAVSVPEEPKTVYSAQELLAVIDAISDGIDEGAARDTLMPKVVEGLAKALGFRYAYFALYTTDRTSLRIKYSAGVAAPDEVLSSEMNPKTNRFFAEALEGGKISSMDKTVDDGTWHLGGSAVTVPVRLAGRAVGVLYGEVGQGQPISIDQRKGLRQLGHQIALILSQAR